MSKNFNIALFSDTIEHRNLKLTTVVVCDKSFLKMLFGYLSRMSEVIRSIIGRKKGPKTLTLHFSQTLLNTET